jgi:hypothetical protein
MGLDKKKEIRLCIVKMPANIAENDYILNKMVDKRLLVGLVDVLLHVERTGLSLA